MTTRRDDLCKKVAGPWIFVVSGNPKVREELMWWGMNKVVPWAMTRIVVSSRC